MSRTQILDLSIPLRDIPSTLGNPDSHLAHWIAPRSLEPVSYRILRKSVDARKRTNILLNYRVETFPPPESEGLPDYPVNATALRHPVVVGAGPAGLFAAWILARAGAQPIILDRGEPVERRTRDIERFFETRQLDPDSNYLFGEGGAGTYSDGKLYTRIKDPRCDFVLKLFAACGAPREILWEQRPHIGSDRLPGMIASMREEIIRMGGKFLWRKTLQSIDATGGTVKKIHLSDGETIETPALLIASGHSARELICSLTEAGVGHTLKPFQVGCRIEHPQTLVNRWQYGHAHYPAALPVPEYHIVSRPTKPGLLNAVSFCMCPGGEIIPSVHRDGELCTNGMSPYRRNMPYANAALIVSIDNHFTDVKSIFKHIAALERKTFTAGGGDWSAPAQDAIGFLREDKMLQNPTRTSYRMGLVPSRLDTILPVKAKRSLQAALRHFEKIMPGFVSEGTLVGLETRVSSPVRFERHPERLHSVTHPNLYLAGEGAGCAGGIVSAAVDGIRLAEALLANT